MMRHWVCLVFSVMAVTAVSAQVVIVRDDRLAATDPAARFVVDNQVATAERWFRRCRLPYRRVNASALTPAEIRNALCLLPANMPDPSLLAVLQNAQRFVVWAWNGRTDEWRQALATMPNGKGRLITEPFPPDRPDGERAAQLAAWLLEGAQLSPRFQRLLRERWSAWLGELRRKRQAWLRELAQKPFADEARRQQALTLLRPDLAAVSLHAVADGTVWLQRLRILLSEHERIHRALAISLEPREGEIRGHLVAHLRPDKLGRSDADAQGGEFQLPLLSGRDGAAMSSTAANFCPATLGRSELIWTNCATPPKRRNAMALSCMLGG
jgi:hypothetical protein